DNGIPRVDRRQEDLTLKRKKQFLPSHKSRVNGGALCLGAGEALGEIERRTEPDGEDHQEPGQQRRFDGARPLHDFIRRGACPFGRAASGREEYSAEPTPRHVKLSYSRLRRMLRGHGWRKAPL